MQRGKFLQTRQSQASQLCKRKWRRFYFSIDQSPQSKNIRAGDAVDFQCKLLEEMSNRKKRAYRGDVFLQLEFFNKSKSPPSIQNLPKNYLDLMGKPRDDSGISRKHLLFRDDEQVKALIVRYHLLSGDDDVPRIDVTAEPFRDFLLDVGLIKRVESNDFEDDEGMKYRHDSDEFREGPFPREKEYCDNRVEKLKELESQKESWLRDFSKEAYESTVRMTRLLAQQQHLKETDQFICDALLSVFKASTTRSTLGDEAFAAELVSLPRNMMLVPPFVVDLHHRPFREGETDKFKAVLVRELTAFKTKLRFLFPLSSLLCVTILVVPPVSNRKFDLDNLVKLILPTLHNIWMPPSHSIHTLSLDAVKDPKLKAHWKALKHALPTEPKYSVTEYRVFTLPRLPEDPKEGLVRLAIGEGQMPLRFRENIDHYLDRWKDGL